MINVSKEYKDIMARNIRNRSYLSVGIGIINQDAQESGTTSGEFAYWSKGNVFNANQSKIEYATLEENYLKANGSMVFVPENNELMQLQNNGITTENVLQPIRIDFARTFSIKGLTLQFGSAYPTEFTVETAEKYLTYTNGSERFIITDVLGDTNYIIIRPVSMVGGQQRFRLQSVLMGVGLSYSSEQSKTFSYEDYVSSISEDLPSEKTNFSFYDEEGRFDVDDESSFIDYLETMQLITVSFGLELDDGTVEWNQVATNYLKSWKSQKGVVTITATDRLSQMEDEYSLGYKIYERTAYEEAESIFTDAGLQPDEYYIDDYLHDVVLTNPMPIGTHKECLQLLANACRCILRQNENGRIMILANFANVLDPDDLTVSTNGHTKWSKPNNILIGSGAVYGELTKDFMKADGQMYFLPEDESYIETSYVSEQVADENGVFDKNLIPYPYYHKTMTSNGITWTDNGDGTVTANGTGTADSVFNVCARTQKNPFRPQNGIYTLSGCPSGGNVRTYTLYLQKGTASAYIGSLGADTGNGATCEVVLKDEENLQIQAYIQAGTTVSNLVFKPQLEAGDKATSYQPYQKNPAVTISMPASYTYYGVNVDFSGNAPQEMIVHTYKDGASVENVTVTDISQSTTIYHEFKSFDTMTFEVTKGYPLNRVLIDKISFGALSDYVLTKSNMLENPIGFKDKRVKSVKVKIFTFANDENGEPKEVEDSVFATKRLNPVGDIKTLNNPLVSKEEHALLLAEWIGNYYANNISYDVKFRGEPRIKGADIIHMESDKKSNLQVEITKAKLSFNGTFSGDLEMRRALKMMGGT